MDCASSTALRSSESASAFTCPRGGGYMSYEGEDICHMYKDCAACTARRNSESASAFTYEEEDTCHMRRRKPMRRRIHVI